MPKFADLAGVIGSFIRIGVTGVRLKNVSGSLAVRNTGDTADALVTASQVDISGDLFRINSDGANTGTDYVYTLRRPTDAAAIATIELPIPGSPGQTLAWHPSIAGKIVSVPSGGNNADKQTTDTTTLAFGSTSPLALFSLPANAVVGAVRVTIDTPFNGTPSLSIGVTGSTSKYLASNQVNLAEPATTIFEVYPGLPANASSESLIATYAGGGATAGSARIEIDFAIPN